MSRELRRVIPFWEHPMEDVYNYQKMKVVKKYIPMYNKSYSESIDDWIKGYTKSPLNAYDYAIDNGEAPNIRNYLPYSKNDASWFQVYETVSEGTPITPPFKTKEELKKWLLSKEDFWGYRWDKESIENILYGLEWMVSGHCCYLR